MASRTKELFRRWRAGVILLATLVPLQVHAEPAFKTLEKSADQVRARKYDPAIQNVRRLLDNLSLNTLEEIVMAHRILGVAYCELGDQPKAEEHFRALLEFSPKESLQGLARTQVCSDLYASLQAEHNKSARPAPPPAGVAVAAAAPPQESTWKLYMPFGVGQFENGETKKGVIFASVEGALFATTIASVLLFEAEKNPNGTFDNTTLANTYRALFWSTLGLGIGTATWGIIDAVHVHNRKSREPSKVSLTLTRNLAALNVAF